MKKDKIQSGYATYILLRLLELIKTSPGYFDSMTTVGLMASRVKISVRIKTVKKEFWQKKTCLKRFLSKKNSVPKISHPVNINIKTSWG